MFDNYLSSEMTGCLGAWDTFEARVASRAEEGVVLAYHGTCDGLVAAAYLLHTLRGNGVDVPKSRILWVGSDDHTYEQLRSFLRQQRPAFLITLGFPVENSPEALADMVGCVGQGVFVFDHHHHTGAVATMDKLVVVNPTPSVELAKTKPMPSSLFGFLCAERSGRDVAPWLVGVALLDEGVEEQLSSFFEELSRLHDLPSPGMVGGPAGLRQTVYGRISRLLSSNFAAREPEHTSLDLAMQVLRNQVPGPDELLDAASERLARLANTVTTEVRRHIDTWRQRITAYLKDALFVKIEIPPAFAVTAPVASILQGHFPEKTVVVYSRRGSTARVEVRCPPAEGRDVAAIFANAASRIPLHCYSAQAVSGGTTVGVEHLNELLDVFGAALDPSWSDDDDDD
jgi:hypothetical protein